MPFPCRPGARERRPVGGWDGWDGKHSGSGAMAPIGSNPLSGGVVNRVWRVRIDGQLAVARLSSRSDADLVWETDLLWHLDRQGLTVPLPVATTSGRHFADGLVVMSHVEGEPPETKADWRRVAEALRALHRVTQGWPQRPGWRSSSDLLHAETGTKIDLRCDAARGRCSVPSCVGTARRFADMRRPQRPDSRQHPDDQRSRGTDRFGTQRTSRRAAPQRSRSRRPRIRHRPSVAAWDAARCWGPRVCSRAARTSERGLIPLRPRISARPSS